MITSVNTRFPGTIVSKQVKIINPPQWSWQLVDFVSEAIAVRLQMPQGLLSQKSHTLITYAHTGTHTSFDFFVLEPVGCWLNPLF